MTTPIKHHGADLVLYPVLSLQLINASSSSISRSDFILKYNDYWEIPIVKGDYYLPLYRKKYAIKASDMILIRNPSDPNGWHSECLQYMIDNNVLLLGRGFPDASPADDSWGYPFTINHNQNIVQIKPNKKV